MLIPIFHLVDLEFGNEGKTKMARVNLRDPIIRISTAEGAPAVRITAEQQLRRSVLSCLLWENEFYEDGQTISDRITALCGQVSADVIASIAIEARHKQHLRHVPLLLLRNLAKKNIPDSTLIQDTFERVISRADELSEFVALYWQDKTNKKMLPNQVKKGLAKAFRKFDAYALQKYNRDVAVKLRDVLFLIHAKPKDEEQAALWKRLINNELATPDTWETQLSAGADKKATFERLITEGKLGYLATIRNLKNMVQAGCDLNIVKQAIVARGHGADRVLPFRFVAAARAAPQLERELDISLQTTIAALPELQGNTIVLVDVSGSMDMQLSAKSDLKKVDAAAALASLINSNSLRTFTFSNTVVEVPPRRGMSGVDVIQKSQIHSGTYLGMAIEQINRQSYDRLIVITDEQSHDRVPDPKGIAYMINVASNKNGVGYHGNWTHLDGFSENVIRWIVEQEELSNE